VLCGIAAIREILGNGSLFGLPLFPDSYQPILFFVLPPGGFLVFALFISFGLFLKGRSGKSGTKKSALVAADAVGAKKGDAK
jgi:electron transport complex protein RnfE